MKLSVPFIYEAAIIKPRHRKPELVVIRDSVEVDIKDVDFPVGMQLTKVPGKTRLENKEETKFYWGEGRLWCEQYAEDAESKPLKLERVFNQFWQHMSASLCGRIPELRENGLFNRVDSSGVRDRESVVAQSGAKNPQPRKEGQSDDDIIVYRDWVADNRDDMISKINEIVNDIRVMGSKLLRECSEPRYVINTFGLGNNHGGTAVFIHSHFNENIGLARYFNASEYEEALRQTDLIASERGDTKHVGIGTNCGRRIEVLIPESVQLVDLPKQRQHAINEYKLDKGDILVYPVSSSLYSKVCSEADVFTAPHVSDEAFWDLTVFDADDVVERGFDDLIGLDAHVIAGELIKLVVE